MARRRSKQTPELSTITRSQTVAYARKQTKGGGGGGDKDDEDATENADAVKAAIATMKADAKDTKSDKTKDAAKAADVSPAAKDAVKAASSDAKDDPKDTPKDGPKDGSKDGPKDVKKDAKSDDKPEPPDRPTMPFDPRVLEQVRGGAVQDDASRPRVQAETTSMPMGGFGAPPEMPSPSTATVIKGGAVEDPTHMPGPREIPPGSPDDVASPPGFVPAGDSRSLRRRATSYEFALIYRVGNAVISRVGVVGTRGVWRVVEYPTTASASHAYAKEASRFVSEGFSDYRE